MEAEEGDEGTKKEEGKGDGANESSEDEETRTKAEDQENTDKGDADDTEDEREGKDDEGTPVAEKVADEIVENAENKAPVAEEVADEIVESAEKKAPVAEEVADEIVESAEKKAPVAEEVADEIVESAEKEAGMDGEEVARAMVGKAADDATNATVRKSRLSRLQEVVDNQELPTDSDESLERKPSDAMSISEDLIDQLDIFSKEEKLKQKQKFQSKKSKKMTRAGPMTLAIEDVVVTPDDEGIPSYPWEGSCSSSSTSTTRGARSIGSEGSIQYGEGLSREGLIDMYKKISKEKYVLKRKNAVLQKRTGEYFRKRKWDIFTSESIAVDAQQEIRYNAQLKHFQEYLERETNVRSKMDVTLKDMEKKKIEIEEEEKSILEEILERQKVIGQNLISERTGKPITVKMLDRMIRNQKNSMEALKVIHIKFIKVRDAHNSKEQELKNLERLGDGLYLKNYEQLRMENQSYCDKIEERDEELTNLRNRATSIIQILAHIREKAHATGGSIQELYEDLEYTEFETTRNREYVSLMKMQRDNLRTEHKEAKDKAGLLVHKRLVDDFEQSVEITRKLTEDITDLRRKFAKGLVKLQATRGHMGSRDTSVAARLLLAGRHESEMHESLVNWLSSRDLLQAIPSEDQTTTRQFIHRLTEHKISLRSDQSSVVIAIKRTRPGFFPPLKHFLQDKY